MEAIASGPGEMLPAPDTARNTSQFEVSIIKPVTLVKNAWDICCFCYEVRNWRKNPAIANSKKCAERRRPIACVPVCVANGQAITLSKSVKF